MCQCINAVWYVTHILPCWLIEIKRTLAYGNEKPERTLDDKESWYQDEEKFGSLAYTKNDNEYDQARN